MQLLFAIFLFAVCCKEDVAPISTGRFTTLWDEIYLGFLGLICPALSFSYRCSQIHLLHFELKRVVLIRFFISDSPEIAVTRYYTSRLSDRVFIILFESMLHSGKIFEITFLMTARVSARIIFPVTLYRSGFAGSWMVPINDWAADSIMNSAYLHRYIRPAAHHLKKLYRKDLKCLGKHCCAHL